MFTSRAEFRLHLRYSFPIIFVTFKSCRPDNADLRLTELCHTVGAVTSIRYEKFKYLEKRFNLAKERLLNEKYSSQKWNTVLNRDTGCLLKGILHNTWYHENIRHHHIWARKFISSKHLRGCKRATSKFLHPPPGA